MIRDLLETIPGVDVVALEDIPKAPARPYLVLYPGAANPTSRRLDGRSHGRTVTDRAVCVHNTDVGAVELAGRVIDLLDGMHNGQRVTCWAGPTIADPDMTTGFRWSVTVELTLRTNG